MKIEVNLATCQNMGQCVYEAPEVFSLDPDGQLLFAATADDSLMEAVELAARLCPTQSITVE